MERPARYVTSCDVTPRKSVSTCAFAEPSQPVRSLSPAQAVTSARGSGTLVRMPSTPVLELPSVRPQRHHPRREQTATTMLRAIGTGPLPALPGLDVSAPASERTARERTALAPTESHAAPAPSVRSLRLRDVAAGGAAATGSWTLAAHLGLLGTATGTFIVSVLSTVLVALATDSLATVRAMLLRAVRTRREASLRTRRTAAHSATRPHPRR